MALRIITDSVSDIPKKIARELDIKILPLTVNFEDESYKDGVEITSEEFFDKLAKCQKLPSTSQVTPGEFLKEFQEVIESGDEAIVILMSSKLSGTYNSALTAKDYLDTDKVTVIDSMAVTFVQGLMVIEAARMAEKGYNKNEIIDRIMYMRENIVCKFLIDDLEYLKKGGRLSPGQAVVGKLLNIKPILTMKDGELVFEDKVRGKKKGIKWMVNWIKEQGFDLSNKTVGIFHSQDEKSLKLLKEAMSSNFNICEILEAEVGAVVGTHAGPGCFAVAFYK